MTNAFRTIILLLSLIFVQSATAQLYEKTGKNFGLSLMGNVNFLDQSNILTSSNKGFGFKVGITRSFFDIVFPEIGYQFQNYNVFDTSNVVHSIKASFVTFGIKSKMPLLPISLGKSKHYECRYLNLKLLLGIDYNQILGKSNSAIINPRSDIMGEYGIGFNPNWSGGHKSRVNWSYYIDFVGWYDFNKNTSTKSGEANISGWKNHLFGIRLTILHNDSYDFLNIR